MSLENKTNLDEAWRLFNAGRIESAREMCRQVLANEPLNAEASHRLGLIAAASADWEAARLYFRDAVVCRPTEALYFFNLGNACSRAGRLHEAESAFRNALGLDESQPEYRFNLGNCLLSQARFDEALEYYMQALRQRPEYAKAWLNAASALRSLGRWAEAEDALRRAAECDPSYATAHNNLGNLLREVGRPQEAIDLLRTAIRHAGDNPRLWNNLGSALRESGRLPEALEAYRRAISIKPDHAEARLNYSMALLAAGEYAEGWREYEWRWKVPGAISSGEIRFGAPRWQGNRLPQATLLLHAEQGLGDSLQFVRYVSLAAQRVGHVILECQPELRSLFARSANNVTVCARGEALPPFELQCPLLSLPLALDLKAPHDAPHKVSYIVPDPEKVLRWASRFSGAGASGRIGLVWAGNPRRHDLTDLMDSRRSLRLAALSPLLERDDLTFVSLQKGDARLELAASAGRIVDLSCELHDFDDTAAVVSNLDLVISVDTSVAHLAGALGKPVWMLSRFDACWRWGVSGTQTDWYPTMRIYRQGKYGDWTEPLQALSKDLSTAWDKELK